MSTIFTRTLLFGLALIAVSYMALSLFDEKEPESLSPKQSQNAVRLKVDDTLLPLPIRSDISDTNSTRPGETPDEAIPAPPQPPVQATIAPAKQTKRKRLGPPYGVHLASFRNQIAAAKHGLDILDGDTLGPEKIVILHKTRQKGRTIFRVIVGPFGSWGEAGEFRKHMAESTGYAMVVQWPKNNAYTLRSRSGLTSPPQRSAPALPTIERESTPASAIPTAALPSALPEGLTVVEGEMIMDVRLSKKTIYRGLLCLGQHGSLYIPIGEMASVLEFPIVVSGNGKKATGWFLKEDRQFSLNADTAKVTVDGRDMQMSKEDVLSQEGEIYVRLRIFNSFFPLELIPDYSNMWIVIHPHEPLPRQMRAKREAGRTKGTRKTDLKYPLNDLDYALIAPPRLDAKVSYGYNKQNGKTSDLLTFSGNYRGDLLFLSTSTYGQGAYSLSGAKEKQLKLKNFKFTGERILDDNPYLTKFTLGDVTPVKTPYVNSVSLERGILLTNKSPMSSTDYDTKTFTGTALPGWDVELYQNGLLVDFMKVGPDGTYVFKDVPLNYGANQFKLMVYGTEGQTEVREEEINVSAEVAKPGQLVYDASATQQGAGVFEKYSGVTTVQKEDEKALRGKANLQFGIMENLSVGTGFSSDRRDGKRRDGIHAGLTAGLGDFLSKTNMEITNADNTIAGGSLRGKVGEHNLNIDYNHQFGEILTDEPVRDRLYASLRRNLRLKDGPSLSYDASATREQQDLTQKVTTLTGSAGIGLRGSLGAFYTNIYGKTYEAGRGGRDDILTGRTTFSTRHEDTGLRGAISYNLQSSSEIETMDIAASHNLTKHLSGEAGVTKYMATLRKTTYYGQLNWKTGPYAYYSRAQMSDNDDYNIYLGVSLGLDLDPETYAPIITSANSGKSGGAACFVFVDKDYNGHFDNNDTPMPDVTLIARRSGQRMTTDEDGLAFFSHLSPMKPTDIEIMAASIKDPRFAFNKVGTAVIPRAGKVYHLEFPLIITGEVDGKAYRLFDGETIPKGNIPVELLSDNGTIAGKGTTEGDGFFFITSIKPGTYTLRVAQDYLAPKGLVSTEETGITITPNGEFISDQILFFGTEDEVAGVAETLKMKMRFEHKVQFADMTNLDSLPGKESGRTLSDRQKTPVPIDTNEDEVESPAKTPMPSKQPPEFKFEMMPESTNNTTSPEPSLYANEPEVLTLIVDVFVSEKTAKRAIEHFSKRYPELASQYGFSMQTEDGAYAVVLNNISTDKKLEEIAERLTTPARNKAKFIMHEYQ